MKHQIFVDASYFCALLNERDATHEKAQEILRHISLLELTIYTGTHILMEAATIISQQVGKKQGVRVIDEIRSGAYILLHPSDSILLHAEDIFRIVKSKNVSYADCISFAIMEERNIKWVLSFDEHFKRQGFKRVGIDGLPK